MLADICVFTMMYNDGWDSISPQWRGIVTAVFRESFELVERGILEEIHLAEALAAASHHHEDDSE
jgi:cytochrome c-type biogenesis protein CcmE